MLNIILMSGLKGSGKDFISELVCDVFDGKIEQLSFAEPLKDIVATTLGISKEALDDFKNNEDLKIETNSYEAKYNLSTNAREILQRFGTEAMKKWFGDDVWVRMLGERLPEHGTVIISDWRFPEEYIGLSKYGNVIKVKVEDLNLKPDSHISENALKDFEYDFVIDNTAKNASILYALKPFLDKINSLMRVEA